MNNTKLCEWLRANSSGNYRQAAEAAAVIEQLEQERDECATRVRELEIVKGRYQVELNSTEDKLETLAAQNVALRSALQDCVDMPKAHAPIRKAVLLLNLPNLAESVLKRRDAETLDRIVSSCREHHCGLKVAAAIRACSDEGEAK